MKSLSDSNVVLSWFEARCRVCNPRGFRKVNTDPGQRLDLICDRCEDKMFKLGRTSTQASLMSQDTRHSLTREPPGRRLANSGFSWDDISPGQSGSSSRVVGFERSLAARRLSGQAAASAQPDRESQNSMSPRQSHALTPHKPGSEAMASVNQDSAPSASNPSPTACHSRRCVVFHRAVTGIGKILGLEVNISVSRSTSRQQLLRKGSISLVNTSRRLSEATSVPATDLRQSDTRHSVSSTVRESMRLGDSKDVEKTTVEEVLPRRDSDGRRQTVPQDRGQIIKIQAQRAERCRCPSECDCMKREAEDMPSMTTESRTDSIGNVSLTSSSSPPSSRQSVVLRSMGAVFSRPSFLQSGNSVATRGRKMSHGSRPSRLSSVVNSDNMSDSSRPGSSSLVFVPAAPRNSFSIAEGVEWPRSSTVGATISGSQLTAEPMSQLALNSSNLEAHTRSSSAAGDVTPTQGTVAATPYLPLT